MARSPSTLPLSLQFLHEMHSPTTQLHQFDPDRAGSGGVWDPSHEHNDASPQPHTSSSTPPHPLTIAPTSSLHRSQHGGDGNVDNDLPPTTATTAATGLDLAGQQQARHQPLPTTSCPPPTGKIRNQYQQRKSVEEALEDCGDDALLRAAVKRAIECDEYQRGQAVPASYLTPLSEIVGVRSQSRCKFPGCGKMSVRTDRAKEHARVHIGNHPYSCQRPQADGRLGCGATFLRKHDRNRHDNGADVLTCDACGANIQGKGREYNLARHRANYCPVTKANKAQHSDHQHMSITPPAPPDMTGTELGINIMGSGS